MERPISKEFATRFADAWIKAWNAHNLEKILEHYSEDFRIESPVAAQLDPASLGRVQGKANVRKYWRTGLQQSPHLKFEMLDLLVGVTSIGLYLFNTASNKKSVELMCFNSEGKVYKAIVVFSER